MASYQRQLDVAWQNTARRLATVVAGTCLALGSATARADVIEVAGDGSLNLRTGAGTVQWTDSDPVALAREERAFPASLTGDVRASPSRVPAAYATTVERIAAIYDLSPAMLEAVVWQESRWRRDAVSRAGAVGLAQLMPATARSLGLDARDPVANLEGGARVLRAELDRFDGNVELALAAYNAGPTRVIHAGGIPAIAETRAYVAAILGRLASTSLGE